MVGRRAGQWFLLFAKSISGAFPLLFFFLCFFFFPPVVGWDFHPPNQRWRKTLTFLFSLPFFFHNDHRRLPLTGGSTPSFREVGVVNGSLWEEAPVSLGGFPPPSWGLDSFLLLPWKSKPGFSFFFPSPSGSEFVFCLFLFPHLLAPFRSFFSFPLPPPMVQKAPPTFPLSPPSM